MKRPFVNAADDDRCYADYLAFFDGIKEILPVFDLGWIDTGFPTEFFVVPEDDWGDVIGQVIRFYPQT